MESRIEQAVARHQKGYNCAQAVICTYCDLFGINEDDAYRMSEAFGLGMGVQGVCGALSGALMLAGLADSGGTGKPGETKGATYATARTLFAQFEERVGSVGCKEIKTPPVKRSCPGCVEDAARLVEAMLQKYQKNT